MLKVVFDTNIYVSAIIKPNSQPALLVEKAMQGNFRLLISDTIIDELIQVLSRSKITKLGVNQKIAAEYVAYIYTCFENIGTAPILYVPSMDENDSHVISTAMYIQADYLVSGDKDILALKKDTMILSHRLKMVTIPQMLDALEKLST